MTDRLSINRIEDLTDQEVSAVVEKLKENPALTNTMGISWAIGMVTKLPVLLNPSEPAESSNEVL